MQPNVFIVLVVAVLFGVLALIVRTRPIAGLTIWAIANIVLGGYSYEVGAPVVYLRVSHILLMGLLFGFAIRRAPRIGLGKPEILILAFIVWAIISACIGGTIFRSDAMRNIGILVNGFGIPVVLLYLARTSVDPKELRPACTALTFMLAYLVFTSFCEHFHLHSLIFPQYILDPSMGLHADRARGPVVNAAEDGGIIAALLVVALHRLRYAYNPFIRGLAPALLLITGLPALWFTQTKGPWIAFAIGLLILLIHEPRRGVLSPLVIMAVLGIPLVAMLRINVVPAREETAEFRFKLYLESLEAFKEHPITGWGLGTFSSEYYLFNAFGSNSSLSGNVEHDTTVAIATENGAIGATLYISFLVIVVRCLLAMKRASGDAEERDFHVMCIAVIAVFVVNGMFADCRFWMPQNSLVFLVAGMGLGLGTATRRGPAPRFAGGPAMGLTGIPGDAYVSGET